MQAKEVRTVENMEVLRKYKVTTLFCRYWSFNSLLPLSSLPTAFINLAGNPKRDQASSFLSASREAARGPESAEATSVPAAGGRLFSEIGGEHGGAEHRRQ